MKLDLGIKNLRSKKICCFFFPSSEMQALYYDLCCSGSKLNESQVTIRPTDRSTELFDSNDLESYLSTWKYSSIKKHRNVRLVVSDKYIFTPALFARFSTTKKQLYLQRWEQCWRRGESTRLPSISMCDFLTSCHMWVEFVGSVLCSERLFPGYSSFPLSSKINIWFDLLWFSLICSLLA